MIKFIISISDIHINLYKRHKEYTQVFYNLYKLISKYNPEQTIITINGDISHAKTQITPQFIILFRKFLQLLSIKFRIIIIPGNHDGNLTNTNRVDTITSLLYKYNNKNIIYHKDSGVYHYENITLVVFSCLDKIKPQIPNKKNIDNFIIGMLHDQLVGAKNNFNMVFQNSHYSYSDFDGCDYVICGHIHLYQTLQKKQEKKPEIFYCGSLIQQNQGQPTQGHGFVQLNLYTKTKKLIQVPNAYGYITLIIQNNQIINEIKNIPYNVRLVIKAKNTSINKIQQIITQTFKNKNIESIKILNFDKIKNNKLSIKESMYKNLSNVGYQNKILIEYLNAKYNLTNEKINKIIFINEQYNDKLEIKDNDYGKY